MKEEVDDRRTYMRGRAAKKVKFKWRNGLSACKFVVLRIILTSSKLVNAEKAPIVLNNLLFSKIGTN